MSRRALDDEDAVPLDFEENPELKSGAVWEDYWKAWRLKRYDSVCLKDRGVPAMGTLWDEKMMSHNPKDTGPCDRFAK